MKIIACIALVVFMMMIVILGVSTNMSDSYYMFTENHWGILSVVNVIVGCLVAAYLWLKTRLPKMAKENRWYLTTLNTNEIKAISHAGKRDTYLGNLFGENLRVIRQGKQEGKIEVGEDTELKNSFLWRLGGAVWLDWGGEVEKTISLRNTHELKIEEAETRDGIEIDISVRFVMRTINAKTTMNYEDINDAVAKRMKPVILKILGQKQLKDILESKSKSDKDTESKPESDKDKGDSLWTNLLTNDDEMKKELGLELIFGQELCELTVSDFNICNPEIRKLYIGNELQVEINKRKMEEAEGENALKIKAAEGDAEAKKIEAEAALKLAETETARIKVLDSAKIDKLQKVAVHLGQEGATRLAVSEALASFQGNVLSLGAKALFVSDVEK